MSNLYDRVREICFRYFFLLLLRLCSCTSFRSSSFLGTWTSLDMNDWNLPNGESGEGFGLVAIHPQSTPGSTLALILFPRPWILRTVQPGSRSN